MSEELPIGFGMALAQNEAAARQFESMNEEEKRAVLRQARDVRSKEEMERIVSGLLTRGPDKNANA